MSELIDNRRQRIQTLKQIIAKLHQGVPPEQVKAELARLVGQTDAGEIAAMEQQLLAEGVPLERIKSMCDLHAAVVRDILTQRRTEDVPPGHPIDTFRRENAVLREAVAALTAAQAAVEALPAGTDRRPALERRRRALNDLMDVDKHYRRKEYLLFPCLERHGITGPSQVMWAKDDEVRGLLKRLEEQLARADGDGDPAGVAELLSAAAFALDGMIDKEEHILLPMAWQTLTDEEWGEIWRQSPEYGWCLVEPRTGYQPPTPTHPQKTAELPPGRAVALPTGSLTLEQLVSIFSTLPLDLTFVDAEDRVRFFSEGPQRIFSRNKAILGRKVQHCHPPSSIGVVQQILDDFRAGRQNVAEFWINHRGQFVHIRYFAVRDGAGQYLGTLEVTQNLTPLRTLQGERRLLQYDSPAATGAEHT